MEAEAEGAFEDGIEDCGVVEAEETVEDGPEDCEGADAEEGGVCAVAVFEEISLLIISISFTSLASRLFILLVFVVIMARILQEQSVGYIGGGGIGSEEEELDPADADDEDGGRGKYLSIISLVCLSSNNFIFAE